MQKWIKTTWKIIFYKLVWHGGVYTKSWYVRLEYTKRVFSFFFALRRSFSLLSQKCLCDYFLGFSAYINANEGWHWSSCVFFSLYIFEENWVALKISRISVCVRRVYLYTYERQLIWIVWWIYNVCAKLCEYQFFSSSRFVQSAFFTGTNDWYDGVDSEKE